MATRVVGLVCSTFATFAWLGSRMDVNTATCLAGFAFATFIGLGWSEQGHVTYRLLWEAAVVALLLPPLLPFFGYLILFFFFETLNLASHIVEGFFTLLT